MKNSAIIRISGLMLLAFLLLPLQGIAQSLEQQVDALLSEKYSADGPGATAIIAKKGKVIYRKAFGMANLELGIAMKPDNVLEIGSMTKQFTAVAILMLEEEGKLNVTDPVTKFFSDYPTAGNTITIHHLLNHTSGIKSYTGMQSFMKEARTDMDPLTLIDVFKNEPMDFAPGEQWSYNNSGYIILGAIIEQVSGMSYEDFVQTKIFDVLGMKHSFYGSKSRLIPKRASGYQPTDSGWQNADYLSMTLPYAAGSLMSTVDDLLIWQEALNDNKLIPRERLQKAFVNTKLNDGSNTNYGYGWSVDEINDTPSIEHGGGIFGYTTYGLHVPSEDVYVAVLANSNGNSPTDVSVQIGAIAIGKPYPDQATTTLSNSQLEKWVGAYKFEGDVVRFITLKDGSLYSQRQGSETLKLNPISANEFYFDGSFTKYKFAVKEGKRVAHFQNRINKATGVEAMIEAPKEKEAIDVPVEVLANYVGTYELQPGFEIKVWQEEAQLIAQATSQGPFEIYPSAPHEFFLKVVEATLVFEVDAQGVATTMTLNQGGQSLKGSKK
ncbi:MAG: serine hydrolase [Gilvibacter sp.]